MSSAIDKTVSIPGDAYSRQWHDSAPPNWTHSTVSAASYYHESRPATQKVKRSASGWRHPTAWSHSYTRRVNPEAYVKCAKDHSWGPYYWEYEGMGAVLLWSSNQFPDGSGPSNLEDLAVNQALQNLSNNKAGHGENLAQRRQMDELAGDTMQRIAGGVNHFKDKRPRDWLKVKKLTSFGPKRLGAIPNAWLELCYGWQPLLADVKGTFDVLKARDKDADTDRVTVKGFRHDVTDVTFSQNVSIAGAANPLCRVRYRGNVGVFVRLDYCMVNPALHEIQQLGLVNPIELAWNLVPYSFVVDWFLPIGSYLQNWTADLGYQFLGGSISHFHQCEGKFLDGKPSDWDWSQHGVKEYEAFEMLGGSFRSMSMSRSVLTSSPAPRVPHFKNPFSLRHFSEGMSLLVAAFR